MTELIESQRDLLTGALEVHLATVSNRLNDVMRRLAAVATVFLPITFLTGYFGQNFGLPGAQRDRQGGTRARHAPAAAGGRRRGRDAAPAPLDLIRLQAACAWPGASSMNACASQQASALNASSSSSEESSAAVASRTLAPPVSTTSASGAALAQPGDHGRRERLARRHLVAARGDAHVVELVELGRLERQRDVAVGLRDARAAAGCRAGVAAARARAASRPPSRRP